jgi:hypothetical protein
LVESVISILSYATWFLLPLNVITLGQRKNEIINKQIN